MPTTLVDDARPFLSGVILAAGGSTRMGRPKQLLPLAGRPLLQHVVDAILGSRLDEVILVLGAHADEIRQALRVPDGERVRVIVNDGWAAGQSTSLCAGIAAVGERAIAAAVLLGDQPHVSAPLIDRLADELLAAGLPIVRPLYAASGPPGVDPHTSVCAAPPAGRGHGVPGHPVFLARAVWPDLARLAGDAGARALIAARPDLVHEVPVEGAPPADVDTWRDYEEITGRARTPRRTTTIMTRGRG